MRNSTLLCRRDFLEIALQARIFGAVRAENKSKNLFFAESRQK